MYRKISVQGIIWFNKMVKMTELELVIAKLEKLLNSSTFFWFFCIISKILCHFYRFIEEYKSRDYELSKSQISAANSPFWRRSGTNVFFIYYVKREETKTKKSGVTTLRRCRGTNCLRRNSSKMYAN